MHKDECAKKTCRISPFEVCPNCRCTCGVGEALVVSGRERLGE